MARALMILGLLAAGCGEMGDPDYNARLSGNWLAVFDSGGIAVDFSRDAYVFMTMQIPVGSSTVNAEVAQGTFSATANEVSFFPERWSCEGSPVISKLRYSVSDASLQLVGTDGILSLIRNTEPAGSGAATFGCFDASGQFTPHALGP